MVLNKGKKRSTAVAMCLAGALGLAGCSGAGSQPDDTFTIMQYESPNSPQGKAWKTAVKIFKKQHPGVKVEYQQTSFDAARQNSKIILSGDDVPDVIEFNKGNADGGQLAAQGLLEPLTEEVKEYGWDEKISGSMAAFAKYNENGNAGSGKWYGIPNVGEYVTFYYNKDMFKKAGITEVPNTLEGFEAAMDKLLAAGNTPISSSAATSQGFNQMWIWYSLVSGFADRETIDDFILLQGDVDFKSGAFKKGTEKFEEWIEKGYVGENLAGLSYEQATVSFLSGDAAMLPWNNSIFNRVREQAKFDWGYFTLPGANLVMGSSGHLWGVPTNAGNKELAYDWIDITLSPKVQNQIGELGGLPLAGDVSTIDDPLTRKYTKRFNELVENDSLSFYPDYPIPGFLDFIQKHMQAMSNGNESAAEFLTAMEQFYEKGKSNVQP